MQQNHFTAAHMKNHSCNSPIGYTTADLPKVSIPFDGATNRHTDGPTVFDCSDIPADNATIILVQVFEPLPHWFSTRSSSEEPGWEKFQRVIHTHVVPYMVQHVKLKAALQKRQGCRTCGVTLRTERNRFQGLLV
jgi:hypothetical protein